MARHVDVWLDGVRLADVGSILLQDVVESAPEMELTYGARPGRSGRDVLTNKRQALSVKINLVIRELFDLNKRTSILQALAQWATGTVLELSNHPGQKLLVHCKAFPALTNVRKYDSEISIDLEASEIPFWVETLPVSVSKTAASGNVTLAIPGTALTPVQLEFVPSGALNNLSVTVAGGGISRMITLSNMSVASGTVVKLYSDEYDRFNIVGGLNPLLKYRTMQSADDLSVMPGKVSISYAANVSGTLTASAYGRWL